VPKTGFGTVSTIKAAAPVAAGLAVAAGVVSAAVPALTEGVLQAMLSTKLHKTLILTLMAGVLSGGALFLVSPPPASGEKAPAKKLAKEASKWEGEWLFDGKEDQPCAIFQQGRVLLLVNERGEMATGKITGKKKIDTRWGETALVGELEDEGKTISWGNDTTWKRP
jgi:hypothetical protein